MDQLLHFMVVSRAEDWFRDFLSGFPLPCPLRPGHVHQTSGRLPATNSGRQHPQQLQGHRHPPHGKSI